VPPKHHPRIGSGSLRAWRLAPWIALGAMLAIWPRPRGPMDASGLAALEPGHGREARSPRQIPAAGWRDILWRTWTEFNSDQIVRVAAGVAFFSILALFPGMAAFVSLYGIFADVGAAQTQLAALAGVLPADSLSFIGGEMVRIAAAKPAGLSATFAVSFLLSVWSANAGVKALFSGLNIAYEEQEKRSFLRLNLITLGFTALLLAFLLLAMTAMVAIPFVIGFLNLDPRSRLLALLRWPALLLVAMGGLSVIYRYGPSRERPRWRWVTWGGAVGAFGWLAVSLLFSWYVGAFAHYSVTYGSLGAVVGFMTWMWLSVTVILLGAELNSEMEHQTAQDSTTGAPRPMGLRGARMADTLGKAVPGAAAESAGKQTEGWLRKGFARLRRRAPGA
jgi:membrane protein